MNLTDALLFLTLVQTCAIVWLVRREDSRDRSKCDYDIFCNERAAQLIQHFSGHISNFYDAVGRVEVQQEEIHAVARVALAVKAETELYPFDPAAGRTHVD